MQAFTITESDGVLALAAQSVEPTPREPDDVLVRVEFSGVNYKDAMVASPHSRVRRVSSLVGGVDAAGVIESSTVPDLPEGTRVAVHGGDLGVARDGGFAQYLYTPRRFISPLPETLSTRDAMIIGTAGVSAMASVLALEDHGLDHDGEVLVTGSTGGVGSLAVTILAARGYRVVASTGSDHLTDWLLERGATRVIKRDQVGDRPDRVLGTELWCGAVDCVGGETLDQVLRCLRYGGAVAANGLVGSADLATTVYPFITRSVALLGIDVVEAPAAIRQRAWTSLAETLSSTTLEPLVDSVVNLTHLAQAIDALRDGKTRGRILVDPTAG